MPAHHSADENVDEDDYRDLAEATRDFAEKFEAMAVTRTRR